MKKFGLGALALAIVAATSGPALAETMEHKDRMMQQPTTMDQRQQTMQPDAMMGEAQRDAFVTMTPALTLTTAENQHAAVVYMSDAQKLLDLAEQSLQADDRTMARRALISASGKLTTASLLHFEDRQLGERLFPLTQQLSDALWSTERAPEQLSAVIAQLRPQLASIYSSQVASIGGGGGGGTVMEREGFETELYEPIR